MTIRKALCLAALTFLATPAMAETGPGPSARMALDMVHDFTQGDPAAGDLAVAALTGRLPDDSIFIDMPDDQRAFTAIAVSLEGTDRLASLDWEAGAEESAAAFAALFRRAGLDPTVGLADLPSGPAAEGSDGVAAVYVAFRPVAEATGLRIMGLNADMDMHHFFLAPVAVAERWQSVQIGDDHFVEDSDRQFEKALTAAGITPRSTRHPSLGARPARP